jgi:integrase
MQSKRIRPISGHVYERRRRKGLVWYWKIRLPQGGEERKALGPVWTGAGRPPEGYFTKRTAETALHARLTDLRRGVGVPSRTGATFADAAENWYSNRSQEHDWKPSTKRDYRSALDRHLLPAFGTWRLEAVTTEAIEDWRSRGLADGSLKRRTAVKLIAIMHGIFERARKVNGLTVNPVRDVAPIRLRYNPEDYDFYTPEEVWALVRAADSEQDGAIYLTAAFTGLRLGELLALRVRDVDFEADSIRAMGSVDTREGVGTPKSGKGRTVPMVAEVAQVLARLLQRERFTGQDDFVFPGETGRYLDGSAFRRRYRAAQARAELRPIRFHDLRHTFGSLAIRQLGAFELQHLMGHADSRTTARYTHYRSRSDEAQKLAAAFRVEEPTPRGGILTPQELAELGDDDLVALIMERAGKDELTAREFLVVIRDEIPEGTIFDRDPTAFAGPSDKTRENKFVGALDFEGLKAPPKQPVFPPKS